MKTSSYKIYAYFILAISHIANNICLFSRSIQPSTKRRAIYYIEVMELWAIISFTNVCTKKDISLQTHNNTTRTWDIVKLSCTIAFSTSFDCRDSVGYVYGTLWLEGIFACFKEIETYIIIIMIIIFNTIPNSSYM